MRAAKSCDAWAALRPAAKIERGVERHFIDYFAERTKLSLTDSYGLVAGEIFVHGAFKLIRVLPSQSISKIGTKSRAVYPPLLSIYLLNKN